jgi:NAD-dependent DNA ligase
VLKDVGITREWLLSNVSVSFSFTVPVPFLGRDKSYPVKLQFGDMTESRDFVIGKEGASYYFNFHDEATIEKRLSKLLSGEDTVIDEVEKEDEDFVKAAISQLKEQVISFLKSATVIIKKGNFWKLAAEEKDVNKDYWVNGKHIVFTGTVSMSDATRNEVAPVLVEEKFKMS